MLVKDFEGVGSGVVLSRDGLILTCYHVVNTPLPLEVVADVGTLGQPVYITFKDVEVTGVHPTHDLALIQIKDLGRHSLRPATPNFRTPVTTGEACYVIGNPAGHGDTVLRNTISSGIISASSRDVEGQTFIQTSASINPGNSGGALTDRLGRVVGIVTWKYKQMEGVGFAIPLAGLTRESFGEVGARKTDRAKGIAYEEEGIRLYRLSQRSVGRESDMARYLAYQHFRMSLSELPNEASPYNNVGLIYFEMEEYKVAGAFLEKAVELNPDNGSAWKLLGIIAEREEQDKDKARRYFISGLDSTDKSNAAGCAENLGILNFEQQQYVEAAYYVKWAMALHGGTVSEQRSRLFQDAAQHLSDEQFAYLRDKNDDFSQDGLKRFTTGRLAPTSPPRPSAPATAGDVQGRPPAAGADAATLETILKQAADPGEEGLRKRIPEVAADARPAFGGAYLILKFADLRRLGVFNVARAEFERYIELPDPQSLYAAAGNGMIVYKPSQKVFELYDLRTFERTGARASRITGVLTDVEMGLRQPQWAMISYADSTEALAARHYGMLDLMTFRVTPIEASTTSSGRQVMPRFWNTHYRNSIHVRLNPDGSHFTLWCTSHSPTGVTVGRLNRGPTAEMHYEHRSHGALGISDDGQRIFSTSGHVLDGRGQVVETYAQSMLFPVFGAPLFLQIARDGTVRVRDGATFGVVHEFPLSFDFHRSVQPRSQLAVDRLVFASAPMNRVVFINNAGTEVVVHSLGLGRTAAQVRQALDGVSAGGAWSMELHHPPGTTIKVEDAPAGLRFDDAAMALHWRVPANQPPGVVIVLLSVTEPGGEEVYRQVRIPVRE